MRTIGLARQNWLKYLNVPIPDGRVAMPGGALMVYFPDAELSDGAAEVESGGFFDVFNAPPPDTWVSVLEDEQGGVPAYQTYVLCYVPRRFVQAADAGIRVNPEECIVWLARSSVGVRSMALGLVASAP